MNADAVRTARVIIRGRVQGVGYRDWTERHARMLGLNGWVRNRPDGTVEALFAGPSAKVASMLSDALHGPSLAQVSAVEEVAVGDEAPATGEFQVRYTA